MTPEIFALWHRRQGHQVLKTDSGFWVEVSPHIYQAFPYSLQIEPSSTEFHNLFFRNNVIGVRFSTKMESPQGAMSYHVVLDKNEYPLSGLPKKARHDVQKGLEFAKIEPIEFARLSEEGWLLREDTLKRQKRVGAESQKEWQRLCLSTNGLEGFESWAAIIDGQLAAALLAFTMDNCCSILYQQSLTDFLPFGVNNALTYVFTNEVINRPNHPWIFYGLHSLDAPVSVDEFKFRMGFKAVPVRQRVEFNPLISPFINQISHKLVQLCSLRFHNLSKLSKTEGMMRFYLQGKLPLAQQSWPQGLSSQKEQILQQMNRS